MKRMNPTAQRFWEANERRLNGDMTPLQWVLWSVCYFGLGIGMLVLLWSLPDKPIATRKGGMCHEQGP